MSTKTVQQIEDGIVNPKASTLDALGLALMQGGALFLAPSGNRGEGVRRAPAKED
jgi:hypothetical protein